MLNLVILEKVLPFFDHSLCELVEAVDRVFGLGLGIANGDWKSTVVGAKNFDHRRFWLFLILFVTGAIEMKYGVVTSERGKLIGFFIWKGITKWVLLYPDEKNFVFSKYIDEHFSLIIYGWMVELSCHWFQVYFKILIFVKFVKYKSPSLYLPGNSLSSVHLNLNTGSNLEVYITYILWKIAKFIGLLTTWNGKQDGVMVTGTSFHSIH